MLLRPTSGPGHTAPVTDPLHQPTRAVIAAALEVHAHLGPGYLEPVYQEALALEFKAQGIPYQREVCVPVLYKGRRLGFPYRVDFVCYGLLVVELKAVLQFTSRDDAQVRSYLKATGHPHGLLLNFGVDRLQLKRVAHPTSAETAIREEFSARPTHPHP